MAKFVLGFPIYQAENSVRVLLHEKTKPQEHAGLYNGFGGKIEPVGDDAEESPTDAMVREFKEETGVETLSRQWRHFATIDKTGVRVYCFVIPLMSQQLDLAVKTDPTCIYPRLHEVHCYERVPDLDYLIPLALADGIKAVTIEAKDY
jgi:8-oxo-dGTP diphosphatase